jgi:1,4-dihydroxy-2-naphthoate octaprenyltransferase
LKHIVFSVLTLLVVILCFFAGYLIKPNKSFASNALGFLFGLCFLGPVLFAMAFLLSANYVSIFLWGDNNVAASPIWLYLVLGMLFSPFAMALSVFSKRHSDDEEKATASKAKRLSPNDNPRK